MFITTRIFIRKTESRPVRMRAAVSNKCALLLLLLFLAVMAMSGCATESTFKGKPVGNQRPAWFYMSPPGTGP